MGIFNAFDKLVDGLNSSLDFRWTSDKRLKSLRIFIKFLKRREKKLSEDEPLFEKIDELERVYNDLLKFYETHNSKYAEKIRNILKVEKLDIKAINKREKEIEPLIEQLEHVHRRISKKPLKLKDRKAVYEALTKPINRKIEIQGAHRINKEITIEKKGELILLPGTELYLDKGIGITCKGKFTTEGTKQQPILITASNQKEGWKNIHIKKGKADINFTKISYGKGRKDDRSIKGGGILITKKSKVDITSSTISGNTANLGGGIHNMKSELSITNSTISGNTADFGGGISNKDGELSITNSTISGNTAEDYGGGIYNEYELSITNSRIKGNTASYAGGIYNWKNELSITSSTISGNTAEDYGGGIYNDGELSITSSTISGNTADFGGGIYNYEGKLSITSSTISGNTADFGGGIYNYEGKLSITNSKITENTAKRDGGGIYNYEGKLSITNSKITENTAKRDGGGIYNDGELSITNSRIKENIAQEGKAIYNSNFMNIDKKSEIDFLGIYYKFFDILKKARKLEDNHKLLVEFFVNLDSKQKSETMQIAFSNIKISILRHFGDFIIAVIIYRPSDIVKIMNYVNNISLTEQTTKKELLEFARITRTFKLNVMENPTQKDKENMINTYKYLSEKTQIKIKLKKFKKQIKKLGQHHKKRREAAKKKIYDMLVPKVIIYFKTIYDNKIINSWKEFTGESINKEILEKDSADLVFTLIMAKKNNKEEAKELLRQIAKGNTFPYKEIMDSYPYNQEKSKKWIKKMQNKKINLKPWLEGFSKKIKAKKECKVEIELNPMKVLRMGEEIGEGCLRQTGSHAGDTITNAVDINKRVIWAKDKNDKIVGRVLIAMNDEGEIIRYETYPTDNKLELDEVFRIYVEELAKKCNTIISSNDDNVELILSSGWYAGSAPKTKS